MSEGVQGFDRAARAGGIPCVLTAKWNIPSRESMFLMVQFYAFMVENKVGQPGKG